MTENRSGPGNRIRMADYDYDLSQDLVAQTPLEDRTGSRLLVLGRTSGAIQHSKFSDIGSFLGPGDLLIFNDSRVIPARLTIQRATGGVGEVLLLQRDADTGTWLCLARSARRLKDGEFVTVTPQAGSGDPERRAEILRHEDAGLLRVRLEPELEASLDSYGAMPLPPYITESLSDRDRYQTVYARESGSAAAPTAGLHFTADLMDQLRSSGIETAFVTLHVGLDTFRPVTSDYADEHAIHTEWCSVSAEVGEALCAAKEQGRRVIAVGTTSARTLETFGQHVAHGHRGAFAGPTSIYITPGYEWTMVDGLITNFHLPKSTLMLMVSALAGRDRIMRAYEEAIAERYRFFSFGDAMLIT